MVFQPHTTEIMGQKLNHALHNEAACKYLQSKPEYLDWIVTTAFYSALHFVEHTVFPFEHVANGITHKFNNIGDYRKFSGGLKSKHELRLDLVKWKCREIEIEYEWLYNTCNNARYYDYKVPSPQIALQFTDAYLKKIKKHCNPPAKSK